MQRVLAKETTDLIGKEVLLKGWVNSRRDHGGLIFIDLRDHTGVVQIATNPQQTEKEGFEAATKLHDEYVIEVLGTVAKRDKDLINPNLETGHLEIKAKSIKILAAAKPMPFPIASDEDINEEIRLKYRYWPDHLLGEILSKRWTETAERG